MAIYQTYQQVGLAEDVQDDIYMISPTDAPVASMSKTIAATARTHQWQEDALAAIKKNAAVEGATAGADSSTATTLKTVYTQIFTDVAEISRTAERVKKYGRASEMNYQVMKRKLGLIRDEEAAIAGASNGTVRQTGTVGNASTARELTSIYSQVGTANILYSTADRLTGGAAITTVVALEAVLVETAKAVFDSGGNPNTIVTDSLVAGYFPRFALSAGRYTDIKDGALYNYVDVYRSQYGTFDVVLDRSMIGSATQHAMLLLDPEYLATPVLDPTQDYALAKVGDAERRQVIRESTFAVLNSLAHGIVDKIPLTLT